ncbi:MAG: KH domain-containing protein [Chloroflexi bacterium]|nr:KH domain-containing protein [Chloroflexota bacterium]MBM3165955.1 KH domain-containing protein [Chloroflexota bacterium]MBM3173032.1 KH domain-containing protein [Chloroflexota bacterium]MBM3174176.1 KH domain-containing protein [Chloroflexota bacterium]MBM3182416.1 KH domain-containing protein [Chloroflexota bacterium]
MKELIEYIARSIVRAPDEVKVTQENDDDGVVVKLEVAPDDKGRVIGRQGRVAEAMRTLLRVVATKEGVRVRLEIV